MAFDKAELKQLEGLFEIQRSAIMSDTRSLLEEKLAPIEEEIAYLKQRVDRLFDMVNEDIHAAFGEIENVNKRLAKLEREVASLKR